MSYRYRSRHRLRDPRSFAEVGARATCVGVQENAWKGTSPISPEVNTTHPYIVRPGHFPLNLDGHHFTINSLRARAKVLDLEPG